MASGRNMLSAPITHTMSELGPAVAAVAAHCSVQPAVTMKSATSRSPSERLSEGAWGALMRRWAVRPRRWAVRPSCSRARRELLHVPAAAERLDERDARLQTVRQHGERGFLGGEARGLSRDDARIGHGPRLVLIQGQRLREARGLHRLIFDPRLLLENAQRGELILDLLEAREHRLPIGSDVALIDGARAQHLRMSQPAI